MPHFFLILLKINVVLLLFAAAYYLILRRLTFYTLNRVFLLFGILFSTAYPFINIGNLFKADEVIPSVVPAIKENVSRFVEQDSHLIYWQLLTFVFYAGALFMAMRLMMQFISLRRMHKQSDVGFVNNLKVRILKDQVVPFSFWQTIYINPSVHKKEDLETILEHEKVHVAEWHTIDIILAEISIIFYWFNPGIWMMKKAVKENIEFITDARILSRGIDRKAYQYSLLDVGTLKPSVAVVNNFNLSDLKKRIQMMNVKRSSRLTLSRYVLILPALLMLTLAFTFNRKQIILELEPIKDALEQVAFVGKSSAEHPEKTVKANYSIPARRDKTTPVHSDTLTNKPVYSISIQMDTVPKHPDTTNVSLIIVKDLKITGLAFKGESEPVTEDLKRQFFGSVKGIKLPIGPEPIDAEPKSITVIGYSSPEKRAEAQYRLRGSDNKTIDTLKGKTTIRYIVNGERINLTELNKLDPKNIKTVMVKRDDPMLKEVTVIGFPIKK